MIKNKSKISVFFAIFFALLTKAGHILALEISYPSIFGLKINNASSFAEFACYLYGFAINLGVIIAVLAVAAGGIYYLISYGIGKFTNEAQEWIKAGILGLLIVVCSALIASTINSSLSTCKLGVLSLINITFSKSPTVHSNLPITTYQEIPIGTLTETLLARKMDCYGFNQGGNPIGGDILPGGQALPTYLDHDRADCLTQLMDGAQKKSQVIADLSDKITDLMNGIVNGVKVPDKACNCKTWGKCEPTCDPKTGCQATQCPGGSCTGSCILNSCKNPLMSDSPKDCCPPVATDLNSNPLIDSKGNPLTEADGKTPWSVKDQIEHGPIEVSNDVIETDYNDFATPAEEHPDLTCQDRSLRGDDAIIENPIDIIAGAGTNTGMIQTAMDDWNSITPYHIFGKIVPPGNQYAKGRINLVNQEQTDAICGKAPEGRITAGCSDFKDQNGTILGFTITVSENSTNPQRTYIHELGHALGLSHPYDLINGQPNGPLNLFNCTEAVMSYVPETVSPGPADTAEVKILYGDSTVTDNMGFKGLDEFRCDPNPIKGDFKSCDPASIENFVEQQVQYEGRTIKIVNQKNWKKLNLTQQLKYFQAKISEIKKTIKDDENVLDRARSALSSCYLAMPYVDLLKTAQSTNSKSSILLIKKVFSDPINSQLIDPSNYCAGFNYSNSSCLKKCNDACPDTSPATVACYGSCQACTDDCQTCDKSSLSESDYATCIQTRTECENQFATCKTGQETCIENCYNSRQCPFSSTPNQTFGITKCNPNSACQSGETCFDGGSGQPTCKGIGDGTRCNPSTDISCPAGLTCDPHGSICVNNDSANGPQDCISSCQNNCVDDCETKYSMDSDEYAFCKSRCSDSQQGNSNCVLNNAGSCLFGASNFQQCSSQNKDQANIDYCISRAYTCQSGSSEYAGYQDCTTPLMANGKAVNCTAFSDQASCQANAGCIWNGVRCSQNTAADYPLNNQKNLKCPNPNSHPEDGSPCYSSYASASASCQQLCPETSKCPAASSCPNCSCDSINQNLVFSVPKKSTSANKGTEGYETQSQQISASQMVGPQCNGYSHNDDPLTFYCENNWWNNPNKEGTSQTPIGAGKTCSLSKEIPVGQTVDNARNWADGLIASANKINNDAEQVIKMMTILGQAINAPNAINQGPVQDYCKCPAKFDTGYPICKTDCTYSQHKFNVPICTPNGDPCDCGNGVADIDCCNSPSNPPPEGCNCKDGSFNANCCGNSGNSFADPNAPADAPLRYDPSGLGPNGGGGYWGSGYDNGQPYDGQPVNNNPQSYNFKNGENTISLANNVTYNSNIKIITAPYKSNADNPILLAQASSCPEGYDETGIQTVWQCSCTFQPCRGNPCLQMTDYISMLWNNNRKLKMDFVDFYARMIVEPRSDIMKQLAYSRQMTDSSSLVGSAYGLASSRILSCTRVEDDIFSPVKTDKIPLNGQSFPGYCYGTSLGKYSTPPLSLTDDWFRCDQEAVPITPSGGGDIYLMN